MPEYLAYQSYNGSKSKRITAATSHAAAEIYTGEKVYFIAQHANKIKSFHSAVFGTTYIMEVE